MNISLSLGPAQVSRRSIRVLLPQHEPATLWPLIPVDVEQGMNGREIVRAAYDATDHPPHRS
jgi:hypothetical protein